MSDFSLSRGNSSHLNSTFAASRSSTRHLPSNAAPPPSFDSSHHTQTYSGFSTSRASQSFFNSSRPQPYSSSQAFGTSQGYNKFSTSRRQPFSTSMKMAEDLEGLSLSKNSFTRSRVVDVPKIEKFSISSIFRSSDIKDSERVTKPSRFEVSKDVYLTNLYVERYGFCGLPFDYDEYMHRCGGMYKCLAKELLNEHPF